MEEKDQQQEEVTAEETPEAAGAAEGESQADTEGESPAEVEAADAAEAPGEVAEEAPAEEQPQEGAEEAAEEDAETPAPSPDAAAKEELTPKQLRRLRRSRAGGPPQPQRSPAERAQERADTRARKAEERRRWRRRKRERAGEAAPARAEAPRPEERRPGNRKVRQGVVVSNKPDKTITVRIDLVRAHPVYGKVVRESSNLHAHDERNQAHEGDVVRVMECRPLSRTKRWRLVEVVEKAR